LGFKHCQIILRLLGRGMCQDRGARHASHLSARKLQECTWVAVSQACCLASLIGRVSAGLGSCCRHVNALCRLRMQPDPWDAPGWVVVTSAVVGGPPGA
jgi:hypothetical protein